MIRSTCLATMFRCSRDKLLEWCYTEQGFFQLVLQRPPHRTNGTRIERFTWLMPEYKPLQDKLHESLRGVLHLAMFKKIVAESPQSLRKIEFDSIFRIDMRLNKKMREMSVAGYVAVGNFSAACLAIKLQHKLGETLPSITPPLLSCVR